MSQVFLHTLKQYLNFCLKLKLQKKDTKTKKPELLWSFSENTSSKQQIKRFQYLLTKSLLD